MKLDVRPDLVLTVAGNDRVPKPIRNVHQTTDAFEERLCVRNNVHLID